MVSDTKLAEWHIQKKLEKELGYGHAKCDFGVPDIVTPSTIVEIKTWKSWKMVSGQLEAYLKHFPGRMLRAHFFGRMYDIERTAEIVKYFTMKRIAVTWEPEDLTVEQVEKIINMTDYELTISEYKRAIKRGNDLAHVKLAEFYDTMRNYHKAVKQYKIIIKKGGGKYHFDLGKIHWKYNYGIKAVKHLTIAANHFYCIEAALFLARAYSCKENLCLDYVVAIRFYERAITLGSIVATLELANLYYKGDDIKQDFNKAISLYTDGAKKGNCCCISSLGEMYFHGYGCEKNYKTSIYLHENAVKLGCKNSMYELGRIYYDEEKFELSFKYFEMASEKGDWDSTYKIAEMYCLGKGVEQDFDKSITLFEKCVTEGSQDAMYFLANLYSKGCNKLQQDYKKAVFLYELAVAASHVDAMNDLGDLYYFGEGVEKDWKKAAELYNEALVRKNYKSLDKLGKIYGIERCEKMEAMIRNMILNFKKDEET